MPELRCRHPKLSYQSRTCKTRYPFSFEITAKALRRGLGLRFSIHFFLPYLENMSEALFRLMWTLFVCHGGTTPRTFSKVSKPLVLCLSFSPCTDLALDFPKRAARPNAEQFEWRAITA